MTVHAWMGEVGRQDRAGVGSSRANRTRGDSVAAGRGDAWRISDLRAFGRVAMPTDIARRLRAFAQSRAGHTGNAAPNDTDWSPPRRAVALADGRWSDQKWHTVTLPNTAGLR